MFIDRSNKSHISDYKLQNKIGKGSFANVFKAIHIGTNRVCAIKRIDKSCLLCEPENATDPPKFDMREVEVIQREIRISKKADHPLIVHFYETFEDDDYLYIVMEYIEGESLLNYVNSNGKLDEDQARFFFKQLISCVEYLHNQLHVTHRDLKAENIIIDVHNNIRLIDFGLSSDSSANDQSSNPMMSTVCGSPAYAAPELIQGNEYSRSVDIWSCGVVLYSMVLASLPFYDENITKLFHKVVFEDPPIPSIISPELSNLISQLLQKNPDERISIEKIKESKWYNSSGKNNSLNIDFSFLFDSSLRINNNQLSHEILFQLRRSGYQITQNSDDTPTDPEKPSISENDLLNDITNSCYTNQVSTAYRILSTSKVNQTVLKKINSYKLSASNLSGQDFSLGFASPMKSMAPIPNPTGNRRTRRYSSVCQYANNNTSLLSPMKIPNDNSNVNSNSNLNSIGQRINTNSSLSSNTNVNTDPKKNTRAIISHSSTPNVLPKVPVNSRPVPGLKIISNANSVVNINANSDKSQDLNGYNDEGILRSPKESFPSNNHEVKFAQPQFFAPSGKSLPQRRHMSFSAKPTSGPSICVPKVSFSQSNFA